MSAFVEPSFLYSVYHVDVHNRRADAFLHGHHGIIEVSTLVIFEFRQSLRLQSFQLSKGRPVGKTQHEVNTMISAFQSDLAAGRFEIANPDWPRVHAEAETLSAKHTEGTGIRFADILHVATAMTLGAGEFLTFDAGQRALAEAEGLVVPV